MFQLYSHMAQGHILVRIECVLGMAHFLTMTKFSNEIRPIIMGETLY
jgi:hypothetical protein